MDNNADEKTLDKIRKLIAQAEGTSNTNEAETFMAKAMQLAADSQISLAEARMSGKAKDEPIKWIFQMGEPGQKAWGAMRNLFATTAESHGVIAVFAQDVSHVWTYGFEEDITTALMLFSSLRMQMMSACENYLEKESTATGAKRLAARLSFYSTYTQSVAEMLRAAKAKAESKSGRAGQIALRDKHSRVKDFMKADLDSLGLATSRKPVANHASDQYAAAAGGAAAKNARLNANDNLTRKQKQLTS